MLLKKLTYEGIIRIRYRDMVIRVWWPYKISELTAEEFERNIRDNIRGAILIYLQNHQPEHHQMSPLQIAQKIAISFSVSAVEVTKGNSEDEDGGIVYVNRPNGPQE